MEREGKATPFDVASKIAAAVEPLGHEVWSCEISAGEMLRITFRCPELAYLKSMGPFSSGDCVCQDAP